ncbi:MAG: hypothetical protein ACREJA_02940 [Candidatus Methylomirabilales bacterium]
MNIASSAVKSPPAHQELLPAVSWRGELLTIFLSVWTIAGAFLDGWAHSKVVQFETFFTPWHGVFYSGFAALSLWIIVVVAANMRDGRAGWAAVPVGYRLGVIGLAVFTVGTVFDFLWHEVFGIEQAGERLASPAHLLLFIGGLLAITSPLRAAWAGIRGDSEAPSLRAFLPGLLSLTLATTVVAFILGHLWGFYSADFLGLPQYQQFQAQFTASPQAVRDLQFLIQARVAGAILLSNLILLAPALLMLRRWRVPPGSMTILFVTVTVWMAALREFNYAEVIVVAFLGGVAADGLLSVLYPRFTSPTTLRVFATAVPLVIWTCYFLAVHFRWSLALSPELWVGGVFFTGVSGLALSLLMEPSPRSDAA